MRDQGLLARYVRELHRKSLMQCHQALDRFVNAVSEFLLSRPQYVCWRQSFVHHEFGIQLCLLLFRPACVPCVALQLAQQADAVQASRFCGLLPSLHAVDEEERELFYLHQEEQ